MLKVKTKIWIENEQRDLLFGKGKTEILELIDSEGSIVQAAEKNHRNRGGGNFLGGITCSCGECREKLHDHDGMSVEVEQPTFGCPGRAKKKPQPE